MEFGKIYRIGNYECEKITRALSKKERAELHPTVAPACSHRGLPYIRVRTLSRNFAIEYSCGSTIYNLIDGILPCDASSLDYNGLNVIFSRAHAMCNIVGDKDLNRDIERAVEAFLKRACPEEKAKEGGDETP